jgi:hypothetical protein
VATRIADGRARVVREIRAAAPLMSALAVPVTARGPWLTAALNVTSAPVLRRVRARAVVVEPHPEGRPDGLALLSLRRRGPATAVTLLGASPGPLPEGRPQCRLYARDPATADRLADGLLDLLAGLRGPWTLRLAGLPLGDPTLRSLAAGLPDAATATSRSRFLVDELDEAGEVRRSTDPAALERVLPAVLGRLPAGQRTFVRAAARLHAAIGALEVAEVLRGDDVAAVLLTLVDHGPAGADRWPWWGWSDVGGLRRELGSPLASLTASGGLVSLTRRGVDPSRINRGTAAG